MFFLILSIAIPTVGLAVGYFLLRGSEVDAFSSDHFRKKEAPLKAGLVLARAPRRAP
jgi:hypothetical protein